MAKREAPTNRKAKKTRLNRGYSQEVLLKLANALLDTTLVSNLTITMQQHSSVNDYLGYIQFNAGTLDEDRYEALRDIVHRHDGRLIILASNDREDGANVRVWADNS